MVNTKINRIKSVVNPIVPPVLPLILLKRRVPYAVLANTKTKPPKLGAKSVILANIKIYPVKTVANPIATPVLSSTIIKRPVLVVLLSQMGIALHVPPLAALQSRVLLGTWTSTMIPPMVVNLRVPRSLTQRVRRVPQRQALTIVLPSCVIQTESMPTTLLPMVVKLPVILSMVGRVRRVQVHQTHLPPHVLTSHAIPIDSIWTEKLRTVVKPVVLRSPTVRAPLALLPLPVDVPMSLATPIHLTPIK